MGKVEALPCKAVICTMWKHMQLQKLAYLRRSHHFQISRRITSAERKVTSENSTSANDIQIKTL